MKLFGREIRIEFYDPAPPNLRADLSTQLRDALGLDNDPAIDALAAARDMAQELAQGREAIRSVTHLHMGVSNNGQVICGHCSGLDDQGTTDNSPIGYPCDTVKRIWEANTEQPAEPKQEGRPA